MKFYSKLFLIIRTYFALNKHLGKILKYYMVKLVIVTKFSDELQRWYLIQSF